VSAGFDVAVIGGGVNGLVCATLLARRGLRVTLLERRARLGGCADTAEIHPGFKAPVVAQTLGPFDSRLIRALNLPLAFHEPETRVWAPLLDGRSLAIYGSAEKTASAIRTFSSADAAGYLAFEAALGRVGRIARRFAHATPPDVDTPSARDLLSLGRVALAFRLLGRAAAEDVMRWGPMSVSDFASEWFTSEPLRALVAASGIRGMSAGPRSAGTTANLLLHAGFAGGNPLSATVLVRGGPGALADALAKAAADAGVTVRRSAAVAAIATRGGRVTGVRLESGQEVAARAVVSAADPKTTFAKLVDPALLDPDDRQALGQIRQEGVAAKVHYALAGLPAFRSKSKPEPAQLQGRIHLAPSEEYLERAFDDAKYGRFSRAPFVEATLPSLLDDSLCPQGRHVMSAYVQFAPRTLRGASWTTERDGLADAVTRVIEEYAPGFSSLVLARHVVTPEDLERDYGIAGGHPNHGEHSLDQLFAMRPIFGWGRYRSSLPGLYLCSAGTHPGGGLTGLPGANAAREIARDLKG